MATYVISDIHGQYNMFIELLDKIDLKDTDTLYILGDVLDRGPHPIKTIILSTFAVHNSSRVSCILHLLL